MYEFDDRKVACTRVIAVLQGLVRIFVSINTPTLRRTSGCCYMAAIAVRLVY